MSIKIPRLDDRRYQQIVDEMRARIPLYCSEWTDHNLSDPGITLIEIFAWWFEQMLHRMNQVPDLHYYKFLEFLGIQLNSPAPARAKVTFYLSAPQKAAVLIPANTEVSTTQSELSEPYTFIVSEETAVNPAILKDFFTERIIEPQSKTSTKSSTNIERVAPDEPMQFKPFTASILLFSEPLKADDACYWGFEEDLSNHILRLKLRFEDKRVTGVNERIPPWIWEVSAGNTWTPCDPNDINDKTLAMNAEGTIEITLPPMEKMAMKVPNSSSTQQPEIFVSRFWLRVRVSESSLRTGNTTVQRSPNLLQIVEVASIGRIVNVENFVKVKNEVIGKSNGEPGQRFMLSHKPVLPLTDNSEKLIVTVENGEVNADSASRVDSYQWRRVDSFADTTEKSAVYMLDYSTGEVRFGPALRQRDGSIQQYGAIPPRGAIIRIQAYRAHGNIFTSLPARTINQLKTSIPYVGSIENRRPSESAELIPDPEQYGLQLRSLLRSRHRAVTRDDYQFLVQEQFVDRVARVHACFDEATVERKVYLAVIPRVQGNPRDNEGRLDSTWLDLTPQLQNQIEVYLNSCRLLTVPVANVRPAHYHKVKLSISVKMERVFSQNAVKDAVTRRLNQFIDPLIGGIDRQGWKFGTPLRYSELFFVLQGIVNYGNAITSITVRVTDVDLQKRTSTYSPFELSENSEYKPANLTSLSEQIYVLCSDQHEVEIS